MELSVTDLVDLDDPVGLSELAELVWAGEVAELRGDRGALKAFLDQRQAALRMMRHRDHRFPEPRALSGRTALYRLGDLLAWVKVQREETRGGPLPFDPGPLLSALAGEDGCSRAGRATGTPRIGLNPDWVLWRAVDACQRDHGLEATRRYVTGVVLAWGLLGERSPRRPNPLPGLGGDVAGRLGQDAAALEQATPALVGVVVPLIGCVPAASASAARVVRTVGFDLDSGGEPAVLLEEALERLAPTATPGDTTTTPEGLVRLLVQVADPRPGEHVVDPAVGEGGLLAAVAVGAGGEVGLAGREADEWAWRTAKARFFLKGMDVDLGDGPSDSFGDRGLSGSVDVVVLDPPLARRQLRRWLAAASEMLGPGGRAVVALPEAALVAGTSNRLPVLDIAHLESVVAGPDRLRADLGAAMVVVVLRAEPVKGPVLFVDTAGLARRQDTLNTFQPEDMEELGRVLTAWREKGRLARSNRLVLRAAPREDLRGGDLRPSTWIVEQESPEVADASERALQLARELHGLVEGPLAQKTTGEHRRALRRLVDRLEGSQTPP